ncbi:ATP-binding protein [Robbsia sp. Bb-Pol-6]|uniref:histidine kinase n=1 Tax=Robbsia betulipollinis TaxID=2981849 RepID=A0ABT3ZU43_9BURK|nr:ATP-binding protein [Robbsia betulipollinis]MCY0389388.1 ATP-binding protein [Robbsia betulipollinis]
MLHRILSTRINSSLSFVTLRDRSRQVGELFGLDNLQRTRFITAVSEISRNAVQFAGGGTVTFFSGAASDAPAQQCVVAEISDEGPGIPDLERLLAGSPSGTGKPALGIAGSRRMVDGFSIRSSPGAGTTVTLEMLLPRDTPQLTTARLNTLVDQLTRRKTQTPVEELEQQNREMLVTLEELRSRKLDLEEADLRKNEFLAMLAHELRNPLAAISLSLELISRKAAPTADETRSAHAVIGRQTAQLSRMVNDLLDVSRLTRGKVELHREIADVNGLVDTAIEMTRAEIARRGHTVRVQHAPQPVLVDVDVARIRQVLNNIIHNAARYTANADEIRVGVTQDETHVHIEVADRGIGIAVDLQPRIFDLFAQGDTSISRQDAGLGIGLTVVRRLLDDHGGAVRVFSDGHDRGSRFVVTLPIARGAALAPPAQAASTPDGRLQPVLVVDDNQDSADALEALLDMSGYVCRSAYDGGTALTYSETFRPRVGIIDIGLPDMTGFELAAELRRRFPGDGLTLIALSGYSSADVRQEAMDAGFTHYFSKPLPLDQLLVLLAETMGT